MCSVQYVLPLLLLPPHTLLPHHCGVPPTEDSAPSASPRWVLPIGCSPAELLLDVKSSRTDLLQLGLLFMDLWLHLPGDCSSTASPRGHSFLWGTSTCTAMGPFTGCKVDICSTIVFSTGCRVPGAAPLHSPSLTSTPAEFSLTHSDSSLLPAAAQQFLPLLNVFSQRCY